MRTNDTFDRDGCVLGAWASKLDVLRVLTFHQRKRGIRGAWLRRLPRFLSLRR